MRFRFKIFQTLLATLLVFAQSGCRKESAAVGRGLGFDEFLPRYNQYIATWVKAELKSTQSELAKVENEIAQADAAH